MLYLFLGHGLQLAGVVYMCYLGADQSDANQRSGRFRKLPLLLAGAVTLGLLVASMVDRSITPFVLTTLGLWLATLPLAFPGDLSSEGDEADSN